MPYTTPSTITGGQLVTTAIMNNEWASNIAFLANPPACRVTHTVNQSITHNVQTVVAFDTESWDTDSMHSTSVNTSRITFTTAGLYSITGGGEFAVANDYQMHGGYVRLNGATPIFLGDGSAQTVNSPGAWFNVAGIYKFAANDYIELVVQQVNGATAARNLVGGVSYSPFLSVVWVGLG